MDRIELDRFAWGIIRRKACQMVGRASLTRDDHDDLVQELAFRLWKSSRRFDPAQAHWKSFVTAVVERHGHQLPPSSLHSSIQRSPFGNRMSGQRLNPDPSTLSQPQKAASRILWRVLTRPMWTHFPLAFAPRHRASACSPSFHAVEPPMNRASNLPQGTRSASRPSCATKATGRPLGLK